MKTWIGLLALLIAFGFTQGCGQMHVCKTVGLPGLNPIPAEQVTVMHGHVDRAFQIVGKATVYHDVGGVSESDALKKLRVAAGEMGADGVVGLHGDLGCKSAMAVKWLKPGERPRPVSVPFVIAAMPVPLNASARGNQQEVADVIRKTLLCPVEKKGYYLLPEPATGVAGGIDGAVLLGDGALRNLGGPNSHLLLEVGSTAQADGTILIATASSIVVRARMLDKQSRRIVYEGTGTGTGGGDFLYDAVVPNAKRVDAAASGTLAALRNLPAIHQ